MKRIVEIEGLRGYLALWVLISHVMGASGYEPSMLKGPLVLLKEGALAVDMFILVSGFVICFLIDRQKEKYGVFLVRRFFRLYPLYIVLFVASIPLSFLFLDNTLRAGELGYISSALTDQRIGRFVDQWEFFRPNLMTHLFMLQGLVPDFLIPNGAVAFLSPSWSISLEWQFYLLAPASFFLATSRRISLQLFFLAVCFLLFMAAETFLPYVKEGAFLPFHIQFFFLGGGTYFLYRSFPPGRFLFLPVSLAAFFFWVYIGTPRALVPVLGWIAFVALLTEAPGSFASKVFRPLFSHSLVLQVGVVSYSIYLSHRFVLEAGQNVLLRFFPSLTQLQHCLVLLVFTVVGTILLSHFLYKLVEVPGNQWGRRVANWWATHSNPIVKNAN